MTAEERIQRVLLYASGVPALAYALLDTRSATAQVRSSQGVVGAALYLMCALLPLLASLLALSVALPVARFVASAYCLIFAVTMVTWAPLMTTSTLPNDVAPWTHGLLPIAAVYASIIWRPAYAWVYLVALAGTSGVLRWLTSPSPDLLIALQDGVFDLMLSAIFVTLIQLSLRAGSALDAAEAEACARATAAASASTTHLQRVRLDALVHDRVLSLLLAAGRVGDSQREDLRRASVSALSALRTPMSPDPITGEEFTARLREATPGSFDWTERIEAGLSVPAETTASLLEAAAEAIDNTLHHAPGSLHSVDITIHRDRLLIRIADDGPGFDPNAVEPTRLGVRLGILRRVSAVRGAAARVEGRPGEGTTVELSWNARVEGDT